MLLGNNFANYYKTIIFVIMMVLAIIFIGKIADIAIMFFAAFVISASCLPVIHRLKKHMPKALAVSLVLLLVLGVVLLIFIPLAIQAIDKIALLFEEAPKHVDKLNNLLNFKILGHSLSEFINLNSLDNIETNLSTVAANILSQGLTVGKVLANSITSIFMISIMVFYLCLDEDHMKKAYLSFFPPKFKKKASDILEILTTKVGGYVMAQLLSMIGIGIFTFVGLLLVHHPHSLIIGFLAFVLDIIPVIGATIVVLLGTLTAYDGGFGYMVLILAIMLLAQWAQNQILRPLLFGKFMDIHPLLIIVSLLIGAKFMGFAGVILGPAFASLVCVLINELYIKQINNDGK